MSDQKFYCTCGKGFKKKHYYNNHLNTCDAVINSTNSMKTVFGNELLGWINFNDNQLLRCKQHKLIEGNYLLSLPNNSSFLDIGSHYGDTVLTMALYAKNNNRSDIKFFSFEPNKTKTDHIKKISTLNKLNITVFNNCVGNSNGYVINDSNVTTLSGACSYKYHNDSNIKVMKLDDVEDLITPVGLMHVDTEGWELEVLKGAHNILSNTKNNMYLICECWTDTVSEIQSINGRTNGILSITPEKDIINIIKNYKYVRLDDIIDKETNLVFKLNTNNTND